MLVTGHAFSHCRNRIAAVPTHFTMRMYYLYSKSTNQFASFPKAMKVNHILLPFLMNYGQHQTEGQRSKFLGPRDSCNRCPAEKEKLGKGCNSVIGHMRGIPQVSGSSFRISIKKGKGWKRSLPWRQKTATRESGQNASVFGSTAFSGEINAPEGQTNQVMLPV